MNKLHQVSLILLMVTALFGASWTLFHLVLIYQSPTNIVRIGEPYDWIIWAEIVMMSLLILNVFVFIATHPRSKND